MICLKCELETLTRNSLTKILFSSNQGKPCSHLEFMFINISSMTTVNRKALTENILCKTLFPLCSECISCSYRSIYVECLNGELNVYNKFIDLNYNLIQIKG